MKYWLLAGLISACTAVAQPAPGGGSIEGHVFNSLTNAPVKKARVILTAPNDQLVSDTDSTGKFQFTKLPPQTYRLRGSRSGFLDRPARHPITLSPNEQVTGAEIRLAPQSVISGRVLDEDGDPVAGARVMIDKQVYRYGKRRWERLGDRTGETSEAGEYRLSSLAAGRYTVEARDLRPQVYNQHGDPPQSLYVPVYYPNATSQQQAVPVDLGVASELRDLDIHLFKVARPPYVHVRGVVTGLPAGFRAMVQLILSPADGGFGGTGTPARPPDYAFDMSAPPGQYIISGRVGISGASSFYGSGSLTVAGDMEGVQLAMNPAPEIDGRISVEAGGAHVNLQDMKISLVGVSDNVRSSPFQLRCDAAGKLGPFPQDLRLPGAHFALVEATPIPNGFFVREVTLGGQEVSPDDFEISSSARLEIVLANMAGTIMGAVTDGDSKPFPGAVVTLVPSDGKSRPEKQLADESGAFRFANLRPGKYTLFAWDQVDDDLWPDPEFRKKYEDLATEVAVAPSETRTVQLRSIAADEAK